METKLDSNGAGLLTLHPAAARPDGLPGPISESTAPDIGNWLCTLGMAALFVEASLLALSVTRFEILRRSR